MNNRTLLAMHCVSLGVCISLLVVAVAGGMGMAAAISALGAIWSAFFAVCAYREEE